MLMKKILRLEQRVKEKEWEVDRTQRLFGGAGLIILPAEKRNKIKETKESAVYTYTKYAREISSLIFSFKNIFWRYLDAFNKYIFYPEFGDRVNEYIKKYGDNEGVIEVMFDTAKMFAKKMDGKLYFAYGSNMDCVQMADRCPDAKRIGNAILRDYKFVINERGVATIVPAEGSIVRGIVWTLQPHDEATLDRYEGVAHNIYTKETMDVVDDATGIAIETLLYVAKNDKPGYPYPGYLERIISGAKEAKIDITYIDELVSWFDKNRKNTI